MLKKTREKNAFSNCHKSQQKSTITCTYVKCTYKIHIKYKNLHVSGPAQFKPVVGGPFVYSDF